MAIARRNSVKKNKKSGRKTRLNIRGRGIRKLTQKGGSAAPSCDGLQTVVVDIFTNSDDAMEKKTIEVCVDPQILQGIGQGLAQGGLLGAHEGPEALVIEFVQLVHKDSEKGIYKTTERASETAELGEQVFIPEGLQEKYLHPLDGDDSGTKFILWDSHKNTHMNAHYFANALNSAREVLSLYTDAGGVTYLPDEFRTRIAGYLEEIKGGSNVKGVLQRCAEELFRQAEVKSTGFLLQMYEQAKRKLSNFWIDVKQDRQTQIEAAKLAMTVAGMVYGGTIGTAISTAVGLSTQAASLFFTNNFPRLTASIFDPHVIYKSL